MLIRKILNTPKRKHLPPYTKTPPKQNFSPPLQNKTKPKLYRYRVLFSNYRKSKIKIKSSKKPEEKNVSIEQQKLEYCLTSPCKQEEGRVKYLNVERKNTKEH